MSGPRVLVLLSIPDDPDNDPPAEWLARLPELEGAEVVWTGPEGGRPRQPVPHEAIPDPTRVHGCGRCADAIVITPAGWMHRTEYERRHR